jgi:hypothetical protein
MHDRQAVAGFIVIDVARTSWNAHEPQACGRVAYFIRLALPEALDAALAAVPLPGFRIDVTPLVEWRHKLIAVLGTSVGKLVVPRHFDPDFA